MIIGILESKDFSIKAQNDLKKIGILELNEKTALREFLNDKEVIFIRLSYQINFYFLDQAKELKFICTPTTGLNHIDLEECKKRGIEIISLKGETEFLSTIRATPEHTIGLLLSLLRNYNKAFLNTKNNKWDRDLYKGHEIYGKKIGIIGLGRVGKILNQYFQAFGASVLYTDTRNLQAPENCTEIKRKSELIERSDIIFLTASYSKENEKMITKEDIDKMKDKYFINTARGELVEENYLFKKISENHFKGVGIDVITDETQLNGDTLMAMLKLSDDKNFILTSHIAGATYESMWRTEEFVAQKLLLRVLSE